MFTVVFICFPLLIIGPFNENFLNRFEFEANYSLVLRLKILLLGLTGLSLLFSESGRKFIQPILPLSVPITLPLFTMLLLITCTSSEITLWNDDGFLLSKKAELNSFKNNLSKWLKILSSEKSNLAFEAESILSIKKSLNKFTF